MSAKESFHCRECRHPYGADNAFVRATHCCPECGANVEGHKRSQRAFYGVAITVLIGVIMVVIVMMAQTIFQV
jgi:hypothetical protein